MSNETGHTAAAAPEPQLTQPPQQTAVAAATSAAVAARVEASTAGVSILSAALISAAVSVTVFVSGLMIYDRLFKEPPRSIATVDLDAIVSARELAMIERLSQPSTTDADRGLAYDQISAFGVQMDEAVNAAAISCRCDILVKGAVIGRPALDLTDQIAQRLGISPGAVAQGRDRIHRTLRAASTSQGMPGQGAGAIGTPQATVSTTPREARP